MVAPEADPKAIALDVLQGASKLRIDSNELVKCADESGGLAKSRLQKPVIYQEVNGERFARDRGQL